MGSLKYQFLSAIDGNFRPGLDKHSYKKMNPDYQRIASWGYRNVLKNFSCNLTNYLRSNFSEVRNLKDIQPFHIESFFNSKQSICSPYTIRQYMSYLRVIEKLIRQHYHFKVNLTTGYKVKKVPKKPNKVRNISMDYYDLQKVLDSAKNSRSPALAGIKLANAFGLRVSEISKLKGKDINLDKSILHIHDSKGKRSRNIPIDSLIKLELCMEIKDKIGDEERVCPLREDSINKFLKRHLIKNNITRYRDAKTGIHSIRKKVAKEVMKENRSNGLTKQQSIDATSKFLGHNENRNYVINAYLKSK